MSRERRKRLKRERRRERAERNRNRSLISRRKKPDNRNDRLKVKPFKNKKDYRSHRDRFRSAKVQQRNPNAYQKFKDREEAYKNTPTYQRKLKKPKDSHKKWKLDGKEERKHMANIEATDKAAKELRNYKPKELNVKRNKYTVDLPPRPSFPKLPKISTPGGDLKVTRVDRPSGLTNVGGYKGDQDNRYDSKPDYSNVYTNLKRKKIKKQNAPTK